MCDSQLGKVTVSLLRRLLPTRLTQVLTQGPGPPFWVQASHGRLPEAQQRYRGTEVRMLTLRVPTEWPTLQLSGSSAHIPGIRRRGKLRVGEKENRGTAALPLAPPDPSAVTRVQILHLLGNQYTLGVLFQTSQKTQWGRGSCSLGHSTKTPDLSWRQDGIRWEEKLRTLVPFDFKSK